MMRAAARSLSVTMSAFNPSMFRRAALALFTLSALACADAGAPRCRVGSDCVSGVCRSDGTCGFVASDAGMAGDDGGELADAAATDGAAPDTGVAPGDAGTRICEADGDGIITRAEVPMRAGLRATFRAASDATVDMRGTMEGGVRAWDLSGALSGDADLLVELTAIRDQWFASDFPGAGWVTRLSADADLLGVFAIDADALRLLGVVSPEDGLTRTRLTYDPPVVVLRFPLRAGDTYSTASSVSGQALGVLTAYTETYSSEVDASGTLRAPFGTFDVLRVRTTLDRLVGAFPTRVRSFAFVSECFGTVATVSSQDNEMAVEFTRAAEARRLAP